LAAIVPLLIFAGMHYPGGLMNVVVAFTLGGVLTLFYLWRRDLVANIIGHFLVDFIANVVPRLVGAH
jgi:membrane protease YdiL (CAAX protease family)